MYDIYQIKLNDTIESLANRYGTNTVSYTHLTLTTKQRV